MSATIESGDVQVLQRFHHQPLPIPTCKVMGNFMMLCHLVYQLKKYQKDKKPVFLFVPRIEMTRQVQKFLKFFSIKISFKCFDKLAAPLKNSTSPNTSFISFSIKG